MFLPCKAGAGLYSGVYTKDRPYPIIIPMIRPLFVLFLTVGFSACTSKTIDNTGLTDPGPDDQVAVSYASDIQPLFNATCAGIGCHVGFQMSGVALDSYDAVMASIGLQYGGPIVIPGNASGSPLIDKISASPQSGRRMPLTGVPLPASDIELIRTWIDDGAPNN